MEAGIGLGLTFAEFVIKHGKKSFKRNWGQFRVTCIDELSEDFPSSRQTLIDFLSRKQVYDMMQKLTKGTETDFKNLLAAFQDSCKGTDQEFDSEAIIKQIKFGVEITEADTSFDEITVRYLQKLSENDVESIAKLIDIHKTVTKISETQDQTNQNNSSQPSEQFSVESATYSSYIEELKSKLAREPETRFNFSFTDGQETGDSVEKLTDWIRAKRKLIVKGAAGGGKSAIVTDLVNNLITKKVLPVLIVLNGKEDVSKLIKDSESLNIESQMDILLKMSKGTTNIKHLKNFEGETWIVVDGLNEIAAGEYGQEIIRKILDVLGEYTRQTTPKTYVLVTDRLAARGFTQDWNMVTLNPLSEQEIKKQLDDNLGTGKYGDLSEINLRLLSKPFFLNIALKRKSSSLVSESATLNDFFTEQLHIENDDLEKLAKVAFEAYRTNHSLSFELKEFEKVASQKTCEKLLDGGIIVKAEGGYASFDHQLMHEFLASRHVAYTKDIWGIESFDILTLESNSLESIYLTMQQITDKDLADKFLLEVYDWNWNAAITSIINNSKLDIRNHSEEIEISMQALVAQKQFDRVFGTSISAKKSLVNYDTTQAKQFAKAKDLKELLKLISDIEPKSNLFKEWKDLFTLDRDSKITEAIVNLIQSTNSIMGWTASNVLRECNLDTSNQTQLRSILQSSETNNAVQNTRRWRVVHVLGRVPSQQNADLLLDALEKDDYHWARYGAARALVEMAAITDNKDLRKHILEKLGSLLEHLKENVLEEIGKTVFYRDAHGSWDENVLPLLEKIKGLQKHEQYTEKWENIITEYKEKKWKNNL